MKEKGGLATTQHFVSLRRTNADQSKRRNEEKEREGSDGDRIKKEKVAAEVLLSIRSVAQ